MASWIKQGYSCPSQAPAFCFPAVSCIEEMILGWERGTWPAGQCGRKWSYRWGKWTQDLLLLYTPLSLIYCCITSFYLLSLCFVVAVTQGSTSILIWGIISPLRPVPTLLLQGVCGRYFLLGLHSLQEWFNQKFASPSCACASSWSACTRWPWCTTSSLPRASSGAASRSPWASSQWVSSCRGHRGHTAPGTAHPHPEGFPQAQGREPGWRKAEQQQYWSQVLSKSGSGQSHVVIVLFWGTLF